uniref:Peptidase n=1 Tax=viral metagenome TaxID=1070528 RepID=A0A6M3M4V6_9ZZZZ
MKEVFYFLRDKEKRPVVTVCLLVLEEDGEHFVDTIKPFQAGTVVARGVAICSDKETPCINIKAKQRNGPGKARKQAYKALKATKDQFPIRRPEPIEVLNKVYVANDDCLYIGMYAYKGFYWPELSSKETRIVAAVWPERVKQDSTLSKTVSEMEAA